jgi:hypothetical protein
MEKSMVDHYQVPFHPNSNTFQLTEHLYEVNCGNSLSCRDDVHGKTLRQIIEESTPSEIVKLSRVGITDIESVSILAVLEHINEAYFKGHLTGFNPTYNVWKTAQDNGYVQICDDGVYLVPIDCDSRIWETWYNQKCLLHKGLLVNGGDNLDNLRQFGVFGNPSKKYPTYLMKDGSRITTFPRKNPNNEVFLWVDIEELLKRRSLFIDPETIGKDAKYWFSADREGDSFFTVAGIPKEAIISYLVPSTGERVVLRDDDNLY